MRINWKIVSGILAATLVYDETAGVINKKKYRRAVAQRDAYQEMTHYLARIMDVRDTPFTEFDRIAVNTIMEKVNSK